MRSTPRRLILLSVAVFVLLAAMAALPRPAHTQDPPTPHEQAEIAAMLAEVEAGTATFDAGIIQPAVAQDTCLHCHLAGEDKGIWTPLGRWGLFGLAGLVFAFGIVRSASVWVNKKPWQGLISRAADWVDDRYQFKKPLEKALSKPVPNHALKWFYCLGGDHGISIRGAGITGIMLAFYYKPTPDEAYASIQFIETQVRFGASFRAIHHWAANGMVVMCVAHAIRVFVTGAYRAPRELNWVAGTLLLLLTLGFGLTGYLLPWDQRAYWATTVATEIVGGVPDLGTLMMVFFRDGWTVTAATLSRFYGVHVFILPIATVALMGLHFIMIRRQGIADPL